MAVPLEDSGTSLGEGTGRGPLCPVHTPSWGRVQGPRTWGCGEEGVPAVEEAPNQRWRGQEGGRHRGRWRAVPQLWRSPRGPLRVPPREQEWGCWSAGWTAPQQPPRPVLTIWGLHPPQVQAQLQLEGVAHAHPHLHPHLAAHAPYLMFPPPPFGLPIASLAESASAAAVVAAAAKSNSKNSSIADLRLKARKHAEALGL